MAGGLVKNKFLMQMYSDVTRLSLSTVRSDQGPALGSAIHAAVAAGAYADIFAASRAMGGARSGAFTPDERRASGVRRAVRAVQRASRLLRTPDSQTCFTACETSATVQAAAESVAGWPGAREESSALPYGTTLRRRRRSRVSPWSSDSGAVAKVIAYGATLIWLETPDRHGNSANIVLAHPGLRRLRAGHALPGSHHRQVRESHRGRQLPLDGARYAADQERTRQPPARRYCRLRQARLAVATASRRANSVGVEFGYTSPDGEEGFPGALEALTTYSLTSAGELCIEFDCLADKPTHVNLTNHSYFNLAGHDSGNMLEHELTLDCDRFLAVDADSYPPERSGPSTVPRWTFARASP